MLITEITEDIGIIKEAAADGSRTYFIEGVFMQSEAVNRNNRIYRKDILAREAQKYHDTYIKSNRAFGELSHPDTIAINLERVSHMIKELRMDGNNFIGKAKIMDTPYGKIVKNFLDEDAKIGVSSRGYGTMKVVDGITEVQKDYKLVTPADIVADPSAPLAFVDAVIENDNTWMNISDNVFVCEDMEALRNELRRMTTKQVEENALMMFEQLLNSFAKNLKI